MLLDESNGGFGVLVGELPNISNNQKAQLHTEGGWFDCRIVHATETVATKAIFTSADQSEESAYLTEGKGPAKHVTVGDIERFTAGRTGPWFRLGIRCLDQIAPPSKSAASLPVAGVGFGPTQWVKSVLTSVFSR